MPSKSLLKDDRFIHEDWLPGRFTDKVVNFIRRGNQNTTKVLPFVQLPINTGAAWSFRLRGNGQARSENVSTGRIAIPFRAASWARQIAYRATVPMLGAALLITALASVSGNPASADEPNQVQAPMSDPKADCDALMKAIHTLAKDMLTSHGSFLTYGGAMLPNGDIVHLGFVYEEDGNDPARLLDYPKAVMRDAARQGKYKATAIVFDAYMTDRSTGVKSSAIVVMLDHRDQYSVVVVTPYTVEGGRLILGETFMQEGAADIFPVR